MKIIKKSATIGGRELTLETGRFAEQANAAVLARYGDTMVLSTVTSSARETSLDYFPLSVEYVERLYAGGRIKGSRWVKREGRPSDDAVLAGRVIDRSIRPLFPKSYKHDVQVVITVLSVDGENDPDILALVATSAAISLSSVPWNGPVAAVRMGYVSPQNGDQASYLVNPTVADQQFSEFDFIVASAHDKVVMLEGGFCEIPEAVTIEAIRQAKDTNREITALIETLVSEAGKTKEPAPETTGQEDLISRIKKNYKNELEEIFQAKAKKEFGGSEADALVEKVVTEDKDQPSAKAVLEAIDKLFKKKVREDIMKHDKRLDGRGLDEIRPLEVEVGLLPRTHGSAMFKRGQTQALTVATLGTPSLEQLIEGPMGEESKRYMHHYSMPPYSVGETGRIGTPSRREIGHGALAERALLAVIPPENEFPYAIRLVSEIMSSNGSTSMASTCGSTLALMDAGVPIKAPVAGISVGLMTEGKDYKLLTDIMGIEDFSGDMDFKVAGTETGITAIQLDIKIDGLTDEMISETFERARKARMVILDKIKSVISAPRTNLSQYAPKVQMIQIPVDRIGEVIGPGGKMIRNIIAATGAVVDVEDDGSVMVSGTSDEAVNAAAAWVKGIVHEVKPGEEYDGEVKRLMAFGAFVEILPGKEGLVHVSKMSEGFVGRPEDVVTIGQKVHVKVIEIDDQRRINLTMVMNNTAPPVKPQGQGRRGGFRGHSRGGDRRR